MFLFFFKADHLFNNFVDHFLQHLVVRSLLRMMSSASLASYPGVNCCRRNTVSKPCSSTYLGEV